MFRMFRIALIVLVGCQEYDLTQEPSTADLPASLPPTVMPTPPATVPTVPVADAPIYANTSDDLYEVDPLDGERTLIGTFFRAGGGSTPGGVYDVAIDENGTMYAGFEDGSIWQVDPTNAEVALRCTTEIAPTGMAFTPSGTLLVAGPGAIAELDLATCQSQPVIQDSPFVTSGDLVGHPDGYLYWTVVGDDFSDILVRVDPNGWQQFELGSIGHASLYGIGYADDELFGFTSDGVTIAIEPIQAPIGGQVPTTVLQSDPGFSWWGATTNPVAWD